MAECRDTSAILELVAKASQARARAIIGIAGPPASGKSTLAANLVRRLNTDTGDDAHAALIPMDGFHLDNSVLAARGLLPRKGSPETFDTGGLIRLVQRIRHGDGDMHYPLFDRMQDQSLHGAGLLRAETSIVVIEGNYLLLESPPWNELARCFDATVFLSPPLKALEQRLIDRWLHYGFPPREALEKARENDLKNARTVLDNSQAADLLLPRETPGGRPLNRAAS